MTDSFEHTHQEAVAENRRIAAPVIEELRAAGFAVDSLHELQSSGRHYSAAVPILVRWLRRIDKPDVKAAIVRALSVPWAKGIAGPVLIEEFRRLAPQGQQPSHESVAWDIGNAIEIIFDDSLLNDVVRIVANPINGRSRQMFVLALAKSRAPNLDRILLPLLDDDSVAGHAVIALGKVGGPEAIEALERLSGHSKPWIRKEAKKAITRIAKRHT